MPVEWQWRPSTLSPQLVAWLHGWAQWWALVWQLARCHESERRRIVLDLTLTEDDLRAAALHGPERARLIGQMMTALGRDVDVVKQTQPRVFRDLQRVCAWCSNSSRCRVDLEHGRIAGVAPTYCSNGLTLAAPAAAPKRQ